MVSQVSYFFKKIKNKKLICWTSLKVVVKLFTDE